MNSEYVQTIVVGGGQAGLVTGHHLAQRGLPFVILDASARIGDAWRRRWDSLRLFTPARWAGLPGLPFPRAEDPFPSKDRMADYLEAYAVQQALPVRSGVRVERLGREGGRFVLRAEERRYEADQVVVAMANYQEPRLPPFAGQLDPRIVQLHAQSYRSPAALPPGPALVVGVGNSGAEIARELARTRRVFLAGREVGHVPLPIDGWIGRHLLFRAIRFVGHRVLTLGTPIGRRVRPRLLHGGSPLVRVRPVDLGAAGVERVPRVTGVRDGRPVVDGGRALDPAVVVWCTGYAPGFSWIDLPVFAPGGEPAHERGVVPALPGLYFVGLHFQYAMSSATLVGVDRDARYVVEAVAARVRALAEGRARAGAELREASTV
jgi:putative flavoprotein involved in K+ transport